MGEETASPKPPISEQRSTINRDNPPGTLQDQIREAQRLIDDLQKGLCKQSKEIKQLWTELDRIQKGQIDAIRQGRFAEVED